MKRRRPIRSQVQSMIGIAIAVVVVLVVLTLLYAISRLFDVTFMNLLKALAVPITVGVAVPWLNWLQKRRELEVEDQRAQDEALQAYVDGMSQLLTDNDRAPPGDSLRTVARARTLTVLTRLDGDRKGSVVRFLHESGLIVKKRTILRVHDSDLSGADLREAALSGANLRQADLSGADLHMAMGITNEELDQQVWWRLEGATMPNGQKYEDWLKSKDRGEDGENRGSAS